MPEIATPAATDPDQAKTAAQLAAMSGGPVTPTSHAAASTAPVPAATPAQTRVNPGGQGYNSGQVNPALTAMSTAPAAPAPAPAPTSAPVPSVGGPGFFRPQQTTGFGSTLAASLTPKTTTEQIATAVPVSGGPVTAAAAAPGSTNVGAAGTTNGFNEGTALLGPAGSIPGVSGALNSVTGGMFQTQQADLSGVHAAQNADYGEAQNLAQERYDYNPGAAPSQTGVTLDTTQGDQTRSQQQQALTALGAAANGQVPDAAELQLRQQAAKNEAANLGAARALGGRSAGGVAQAAATANASTNAATNSAAATQRAADQATARQQQIDALSGVRTQDTTQAQDQATLDQSQASNNLTAQVTTNAQTEAQKEALLQAQLTAMGQGTTAAGAGATASVANAASQNTAKGGLLNTISSFAGL